MKTCPYTPEQPAPTTREKTMNYDPTKHNRKTIRLKEFDYSQPGAYFVTIVTHERLCLFGAIQDHEMHLNQCGQIVRSAWLDLPKHYKQVESGAFCIMPNHVHGIIILNNEIVEAGQFGWQKNLAYPMRPIPETVPLFEVMRAYKSFSAKNINVKRKMVGKPVWQRSYYEHIIRNDSDYKRIQYYIENNPVNWNSDDENLNR
jgi:putative transposase